MVPSRAAIDATVLPVLGVQPMLGRSFSEDDARAALERYMPVSDDKIEDVRNVLSREADHLAEVARRINSAAGFSDVVIRWGGEEFLLVLPGATLSTAQTVLARLRAEACAGLVHGPAVTFSAGVAAYRGTESADALLAAYAALPWLVMAARRFR